MNNDPFQPPTDPTPTPTPPASPTPPQFPPTPAPVPLTSPSYDPAASVPGKTLGIIGLILAVLTGLIGVIVSIIALVKSKKAGHSNIPAVAGIIIGSIMFIGSVIFASWLLGQVVEVANKCSRYIDQDARYSQCVRQQFFSGQESTTSSQPPASTSRTSEYNNQNITFNYPSDWTLKPAGGNVTHIDGNGVAADTWQNIAYETSVIGQYASYDYGDKDSYTMEHIRGLMEPTAESYTLSAAKSVNATIGFGCATESNDFSFISSPEYIEKDGLAGLVYSFECTGYAGKVKGVYYTAYDLAGNRHVLAGTVLYKDRIKYFGQLEDMVDSFRVTSASTN